VLERIESGELIPSDEVAAKIDRYLNTIGGRA
jgi:ribosome-binding protein aMBF1 (putative translation factor)